VPRLMSSRNAAQLGARGSLPCQPNTACAGDPGLMMIAARVPFGTSANVDSVASPPIKILPSSAISAHSRSTVKDFSPDSFMVPATSEPAPVASSSTVAPMGGNRKVPDASSAGLGDGAAVGWPPVSLFPGRDWQAATASSSTAAAGAIDFAFGPIVSDLLTDNSIGAETSCLLRLDRGADPAEENGRRV
jgi:hypothetical protein